MHLQTIVHSVAFFWHRKRGRPSFGTAARNSLKSAIRSSRRIGSGYSPGVLTPQGERGTGRSCFLYSSILPHPGEAVKHFYALFQKKMPGQGNGGTAFLPFPR